jgi:hypothetical protein
VRRQLANTSTREWPGNCRISRMVGSGHTEQADHGRPIPLRNVGIVGLKFHSKVQERVASWFVCDYFLAMVWVYPPNLCVRSPISRAGSYL